MAAVGVVGGSQDSHFAIMSSYSSGVRRTVKPCECRRFGSDAPITQHPVGQAYLFLLPEPCEKSEYTLYGAISTQFFCGATTATVRSIWVSGDPTTSQYNQNADAIHTHHLQSIARIMCLASYRAQLSSHFATPQSILSLAYRTPVPPTRRSVLGERQQSPSLLQ